MEPHTIEIKNTPDEPRLDPCPGGGDNFIKDFPYQIDLN